MKTLLLAVFLASSAHAQTLLEHVAFASTGIEVSCSEFRGRVASGGDIVLRDFRITMPTESEGCPVKTAGELKMQGGAVEKAGQKGCVEARRAKIRSGSVGRVSGQKKDLGLLTSEMYEMSESLIRTPPENSQKIVLGQENFSVGNLLTIIGKPDRMLILEVRGQRIDMQHVAIRIVGGVKPENIAWVFPDATDILIDRSGVNPVKSGQHVGLPGTFFAPKARVVFLNARITGALYAHEISGPAGQESCIGQVSGQLHPSPLRRFGKF